MTDNSHQEQSQLIRFLRPIPNNNFKLPEIKVETLCAGTLEMSILIDRPTILNFFITQCGPCKHEFPTLLEMKNILRNEMRVIAINVGENREDIVRYFQEVSWDGAVVLDPKRELAKNFGVFAYPTTYLIDSAGQIGFFIENGRINQNFIGSREWSSEIMLEFFRNAAREMMRRD